MTEYSDIYEQFLLRVSQYSFYDNSIEDREKILNFYLKQACVRLNPYCEEDLYDYNDDLECFNIELSNEIIYLLVENMALVWLKTQRDSEENTKNMLGTADYSAFSPANLLTSLRKAYSEADKEVAELMNEHSLRNLDTNKLMEVLNNE